MESQMRSWFKIVDYDGSDYKTLFHGVEGSRKLEFCKWLPSVTKEVTDGSSTRFYMSGWHIAPSYEECMKYLEAFKHLEQKRIVRCRAKKVRPKPNARGDIWLAKEIYIVGDVRVRELTVWKEEKGILTTRICSQCGKEKSLNNFSRRPVKKTGKLYRHRECKRCERDGENKRVSIRRKTDEAYRAKLNKLNKKNQIKFRKKIRDYRLRKEYGITSEDYERMMEEQDEKCAICRKGGFPKTGPKRLNIDHNHTTGKVRGLLCVDCNNGVGRFHDDIDFMHNAIQYLIKHDGKEENDSNK